MKFDQILDFWQRYKSDKRGIFGLIIIIVSIIVALFAPWISPYSPSKAEFGLFEFPSLSHLMGTDALGRDVLSRMIWGTQISLVFALAVAVMSLTVGLIIGSISGYAGGFIDDILSRFTEVLLVIPTLFLMIVLVALFGQRISVEIVVIALTIWPANAKIARSQVLAIKSQPFVEAAVADGGTGFRILFRHILPNGMSPLIVNGTLQMGQALLWEAGLSFLGLGDLNVVSWGRVLYLARYYIGSAWWSAIFPGVAIFLLVLAFNLIGEGINHTLNPKLKEERGI
jgi:peptide/nickel transport system permease protein